MTRKAATQRLTALAKMRQSIRAMGPVLVAQLCERPAAPGGAGAAYRLVLAHLGAELVALERRLDDAERAYTAARLRVDELKNQRQRARSSLARRHRRIKRFLTGFYQRRDLDLARVTGASPDGATALARDVTFTVRFLRRLDQVGPPILEVTFDAPAMADRLEADAGELRTLIAGVETARAGAVAARSLADRTVAEVGRVAPAISRCAESLCLVADERLAKRLRKR